MEPGDLIDHAKFIVRTEQGKPRQIALRRAISASYYGLFHAFLRRAADDLIGSTQKHKLSTACRLIYRAFEHGDMRSFCEAAAKQQLPRRYEDILGRPRFGGAIRAAAERFVRLQKSRHVADYDPQFRFKKSDALQAIEHAVAGSVFFDTAPKGERRDFLLCMLVQPR
jgi:hypothetical protein